DVANAQRQVMERVAALLEELRKAWIPAQRLLRRHELQRSAVREVEEGGAHFLRRDHLAIGALLPEKLFDERDRGAHVLHADGGVVEPGRGNAGGLYSLLSGGSRGRPAHLAVLAARQPANGIHDLAERRLRSEHGGAAHRLELC